MARTTGRTGKKSGGGGARRPATTARSSGVGGGGGGIAARRTSGNNNNDGNTNGNGAARFLPPINDITAFPLLTEEVSLPSAVPGLGGGAGGDVGTRALAAVRDVLGWRPNPGDPRGFKSALEQSFQLSAEEGHVAWTYTPRGYAMLADMGAVTGAQASLLNRARSAMDLVRPLISSLVPLGVFSAPEDYEPIRGMVLAELDTLVNELAQQAGPRTQVVDDAFSQLLGADIVQPVLSGVAVGPDRVEQALLQGMRLRNLLRNKAGEVANVVQAFGHLYTLQERMGLNRNQVNTVDDERMVSNFMTVEDTIYSLWLTWVQERSYFGRVGELGFEPFLGTQLVLVSRSLSVVAEAVQELYFSLDSVFIGPPERQTIRLDLGPAGALYLSELLAWAEDVATTSGPRYVNDGGKDGVIALTDRLRSLSDAVAGAALIARSGSSRWPGLASPRVRFALDKLNAQISELIALTDDFRRDWRGERIFEAPVTPVLSDQDAD